MVFDNKKYYGKYYENLIGFWRYTDEWKEEYKKIKNEELEERFKNWKNVTLLSYDSRHYTIIDENGEIKTYDRYGSGLSVEDMASYSEDPNLPLPIENSSKKSQNENDKWVEKLKLIEKNLTPCCYLGFSGCRICGNENGSMEYGLSYDNEIYIWPEGYSHYVKEHNIEVPDYFWKFITRADINSDKFITMDRS